MAKILLALHQFFPRFYTGTETLTQEVAKELQARGHSVVIVCVEPETPDHPGQKQATVLRSHHEDVPVWRIFPESEGPPQERLDRESHYGGLIPLFTEILNQEKPDLVHAFHLMRLTLSFVETVKKAGIPLYFTATDFWILCPTYQLLRHDQTLCAGPDPTSCFRCLLALYAEGMTYRPWQIRLGLRFPRLAVACNAKARSLTDILRTRIERNRRILSLVDCVFWSNDFLRRIFACNGFEPNRQAIIPFPVPEKARDLFDLEPPSESPALNVAFVGTLVPSKGPQVVIEAVRGMEKTVPIQLHVWGAALHPSFMEELQKFAQEDQRIHFRGTFPQEKFSEVMQDMDVLVIPSLWYENTPLTALSCLAARRVLIASDIGGLAPLVEHGQNGFLFPPGDYRALAAILVSLARDKSVLSRMACAITPPHTVSSYVDALMPYYDSAIQSSTGRHTDGRCS